MSLSVEELKVLSRIATTGRSGPPEPDSHDGVRLAAADPAEVAAHLDSEDRNVRVAALRVLAFADGPVAVKGILQGLDDPVKRVREVAAKCSARFISDPQITARLQRAVADDETGSARPAFGILAGLSFSTNGLAQFEPVVEALAELARLPRYRQEVLSALLRTPKLTEETKALLRDYVANGSKAEAVAATRRLCGFWVTRQEALSDEQLRGAERAWGQVWYWVPAPTVG